MQKATLSDFKVSLTATDPPENASVYSRALWWAGKGNWDQAHTLIQDVEDSSAARIHAYLHRVEGDISNAQYWDSKAKSTLPSISIQEEWENLVIQFAVQTGS
jgi:hypothetical protein